MGFEDYKGTPFMKWLLPVIPPGGVELSPNSKLTRNHLGKIPGYWHKKDNTWSSFPWQHLHETMRDELLPIMQTWYRPHGGIASIGFNSKLLPAIDIDVEDASLCATVVALAKRVLGEAPIRYRENSPRKLMCYRLDDTMIRLGWYAKKMHRVYVDQAGREHAVELLGDGQQWLVEGRHPTGALYQWERGRPVDWGWEKLTTVTPSQLREFFEQLDRELQEAGYTIKTATGGQGVSRPIEDATPDAGGGDGNPGDHRPEPRQWPESQRHRIGPDHPEICPDRGILERLLAAMPASAPQLLEYDEWVKVCGAIKTACAGSEVFYEQQFLPWALEGHASNTREHIREKWDSFQDSAVGWTYLCDLARGSGFCEDIQVMFEKITDGPESASPETAANRAGASMKGPVPKPLPEDFDVRRLPVRRFALGQRFMSGTVTLGVGAPGAGKSCLSIASALSIAIGRPLTGEEVRRSGNVWIHNNEDDLDELYRRIGGLLEHHQIPVAEARDHVFITSGLDEPLVIALKSRDTVRRTEAAAELLGWIKEKRIVHMVIDPLISTHRSISENSNEDIAQVIDMFQHIAHASGCSIDLIHHTQKQRGDPEAPAGNMNAARGASSLIGSARIIYTVAPMSPATAKTWKVPPELVPRLIRLDQGKGNYSARDVNPKWFELVSIDLHNGLEEEEPFRIGADTVAAPVPWQPPAADAPAAMVADREAIHQERLQRVRDLIAEVMPRDRTRLNKILPATEQAFRIKDSAARKLIQEAIPPGVEVFANVNGERYSLRLDREGNTAPYPISIIRTLWRSKAA